MPHALLVAGVFVSAVGVPIAPTTTIKIVVAYTALWMMLWGFAGTPIGWLWLAPAAVVGTTTLASLCSPWPWWRGLRPGMYRGDGIATTATYAATVLAASQMGSVEARSLERDLVLVAAAIAALGLLQTRRVRWALLLGSVRDGFVRFGGRPYGTLGNPAFLGGYLCLAIPVAVWLVRSGSLLWAVPLVFLVGAMILTVSRGAWFGLAVGAGTVLPVAAVIPAWLSHPQSLQGRLRIWAAAWDLFRQRPWTGWGLNAVALKLHADSAERAVDLVDAMHAEPLQLLVTTGLLGFAATVWMFATFLRLGDPVLRAAIVGYGVWLGTEWGAIGAHNTFWALVGLSYAVR